MKTLLFLQIALFVSCNLFSTEYTLEMDNNKDLELLEEALEIVASMSENIANLAIQNKAKINSPEMTKKEAVELVEKITKIVIIALKKTKQKKNRRKIFLYSQEELNAIVDQIADKVLQNFSLH